MKLSGRFDITNRAMDGVVAPQQEAMVERTSDGAMLTTKSAALRLALPRPFFADARSWGEFEREADHGSLLTRRFVGSIERLRNLDDRLLAGHDLRSRTSSFDHGLPIGAVFFRTTALARFTLG